MRIGLIASQQYSNPYKGQKTSEGAQMRKVIEQIHNLWKARGIDSVLGPDFDFNKDGTRSFKDNVRWENANGPFDLLLSFHSNAAGDSMVLWGPSTTSEKYGRFILNALNFDNPFPGDQWTYFNRKVSEVGDTKSPAVLIELSRHDTQTHAAELVRRIADGSLAAHLDRVLSRALGLPLPTATPVQPTSEETMTDITPAAIRQAFADAEPEFGWVGRNAKDAADKGTTILDRLDTLSARLDALTVAVSPREGEGGSGPGRPDPVDQGAIADAVWAVADVVREAAREGVLQALTDYEAGHEVPKA